ncbi:MAG: hypothetical protein COZ17_10470 [Flavobacteriaceae bacterium CG_4_10_14_3_um_filter_33_47]|nr:MAG: hypothetical protein COZ17_10470 [Flavobacteriaceae bacterium CG_4_10_14_3_um_filter_33_47]
MKKLYMLFFTILISGLSFGQTVFINEIHYDDASGDADEGVEIAGPAGTDLTGYTITPYNGGNGGATYTPITALSGIIPDEGGTGYGAIWFPVVGLQNGAPDGIALDNGGSLIQFLSYEGSFTGAGGVADLILSTDIGVSEAGEPDGLSLQLTGTGFTYNNFSWTGPVAHSRGFINAGQTFGTPVPSLALSAGFINGDTVIGNPEDVNASIDFITTNFTMSMDAGGGVSDNSGDGYIEWAVTNMGSPVDSGNIFTSNDGFEYPITGLVAGNTYVFFSELVDNAGASLIPAITYSFTITIPAYNDVATIADLRAGTVDPDTYYRVTGEVINTYSRGNRNQKYFQDATGGILVDDALFEISSTYNEGDGVTNIRGNLSVFNGVLQFVPTPADWGAATSTGNAVTIPVVDIATLSTSWENYESELVRINGVTFADGDGMNTFSSSTNYNISDGSSMFFRTTFFEADYIGQTIPSGSTDIVAIVGEVSGTPNVTARSLSELTLSTKNNQIQGFNMYPNPTSLGYVTIASKNNAKMSIAVFDILGKQVLNKTVSNNTLNVSSLKSGVYIMKVSQDNASVTKKLVIQ